MAIYLLNFISIPIYDLLFKNKKRMIIFLLSVQMFLILALRADTLGVDLGNYKIYFEHYNKMSFMEIIKGFRPIGGSAHDYGVESGYVLFNWIIAKMGFSFHSYLVIYAAIVVISTAIFMDRYCEDPALGFATFISVGGFVSLFGILRQSLGFAVLLFAIPALVKRKFWRYLIIVFIAGLFHQSLLIAILLYPFAKFKANKTLYISVLLASLILVVLTPTLYNNIIFPILLKLGRYYYISDFAWNNMFAVMILLAVLIMVFFKHRYDSDNAMQCGYLMTVPIQALAFYIPVFSRLAGSVFTNFLCVLIPGTVYSFEGRSQRIQAKTVAYAGLFVFYLYTLLTNDVIVPYVPVWNAVA
ncbi:MAG: EpsG family protein [Clostridia bacterium]|nr:EpsG family protein [Clostridia bacterium]